MPVGIDTESERLIGLGIVGIERAIIVAQQGGTMRTTDVQAHIGRIAPIEAMAVDTPLELCILNQGTFVERREIAFVDAHFAPHLIAWRNQTVTDAVVDAVRTHIDGERLISMPTVFIFGGDRDAERVARILSEQSVPVVKVEIDRFFALAV